MTEVGELIEAPRAEHVIVEPDDLRQAGRLEATYGGGEWAKAQWVHYSSSGSKVQTEPGGPVVSPDGGNYTVHYYINLVTGERVEFKFTNKP